MRHKHRVRLATLAILLLISAFGFGRQQASASHANPEAEALAAAVEVFTLGTEQIVAPFNPAEFAATTFAPAGVIKSAAFAATMAAAAYYTVYGSWQCLGYSFNRIGLGPANAKRWVSTWNGSYWSSYYQFGYLPWYCPI